MVKISIPDFWLRDSDGERVPTELDKDNFSIDGWYLIDPEKEDELLALLFMLGLARYKIDDGEWEVVRRTDLERATTMSVLMKHAEYGKWEGNIHELKEVFTTRQ